ncbi:hypothetical protein D3C76_1569560 [compost metagenome]
MQAAARANSPITASDTRQEKKSVSTPVTNRPLMPPMEFPLIYSPMEKATKLGWISSLK